MCSAPFGHSWALVGSSLASHAGPCPVRLSAGLVDWLFIKMYEKDTRVYISSLKPLPGL